GRRRVRPARVGAATSGGDRRGVLRLAGHAPRVARLVALVAGLRTQQWLATAGAGAVGAGPTLGRAPAAHGATGLDGRDPGSAARTVRAIAAAAHGSADDCRAGLGSTFRLGLSRTCPPRGL